MMLTNLLRTKPFAASVFTALTITGCGGGGGDASTDLDGSPVDGSAGGLVQIQVTDDLPPPGDITQYGAINVADDVGVAADVVASFFALDGGIAADALTSLFTGDQSNCEVIQTPDPTFFSLSAVFLPEIPATLSPIAVGDSLTLNSSAGQYALLELTDIGEFTFYSLPVNETLPDGPVPDDLSVNLPPESGEFEGTIDFPTVEPLVNFSVSDTPGPLAGETIFSNSIFTWEPSQAPAQWVRIETQTVGGFFLDESTSVNCVVPDTGFFSSTANVQEQLGGDFEGATPLVSRLSIETIAGATTAVFVIRESFVE